MFSFLSVRAGHAGPASIFPLVQARSNPGQFFPYRFHLDFPDRVRVGRMLLISQRGQAVQHVVYPLVQSRAFVGGHRFRGGAAFGLGLPDLRGSGFGAFGSGIRTTPARISVIRAHRLAGTLITDTS